jgi:hypothetical protein
VALQSTGVYWIPLYDIAQGIICMPKVSIVRQYYTAAREFFYIIRDAQRPKRQRLRHITANESGRSHHSPDATHRSTADFGNASSVHPHARNNTTISAMPPKTACTIVPFVNVAAPNRPATTPPVNKAI